MTKRSRLRVQKTKRGKRVIGILLFCITLGVSSYQVERHFDLLESGRKFLVLLKQTFSPEGFVRGTIYDRNLKQLAVTMERVSVYVRTREIDSIPETAKELGGILELDAKKFQNQLESGTLRLWVAEDISQEQEELIKQNGLPGVYLQRDLKRYYPHGKTAAHLLGYVEDGFGLSGVEFYYDHLLASRKLQQRKKNQPLSNTQDLVLTVDLKIQTILESIVEDISKSEKAYRVAACLVDAEGGDIIAGAQLPSFDPNNFARYSQVAISNVLLAPLYLPDGFRRLLRDAAMLYSKQEAGEFASVWSLVSPGHDFGSQLQFWDILGLEGGAVADFLVGSQGKKNGINAVSPASPVQYNYGMTPELVSPLQLINSLAILLGTGRKIQPHLVKKAIDIETEEELLLLNSGNSNAGGASGRRYTIRDLENLFGAQATRIESGAHFLRDSIVLQEDQSKIHRTFVNDLTLARIPSGTGDLVMLVLVQKDVDQVERKTKNEGKTVQSIIDAKVARISIMHQVAITVADVVEPELPSGNNYQGELKLLPGKTKSVSKKGTSGSFTTVMPDLIGLSLRKSLRLLQGVPVDLKIEGTGRVVDQRPLAGASLKGVEQCVLHLATPEDK